jgi:hypothetical protein
MTVFSGAGAADFAGPATAGIDKLRMNRVETNQIVLTGIQLLFIITPSVVHHII